MTGLNGLWLFQGALGTEEEAGTGGCQPCVQYKDRDDKPLA